jgi:hypothetical protein
VDFGFEDFTDGVPELFAGLTLEVVGLPGGIGQAPALKMACASYQKISRALAAVAHAPPRECGVSESLVREAELLRSFPLAETTQFPGQRPRITTIGTWAAVLDLLRTNATTPPS